MNTIVNQHVAVEVAKQLLKIKAVTINTKKPFRYVSGMLAPIYTDNRLLISHPVEWSVVIDNYVKIIKEHQLAPDVLSGTATAAIPHASVIANKLQIPMVYVRSAKKEHGKENLIEGEFSKGSKVLIVEDLISTGKSIAQNVQAIRESGGVVTECLAITTSTVGAFNTTIKHLDITLLTLTDIETIIQTALTEKYISAEQENSIQLFLKNPQAWGKNMKFE